MRAIFIIFRNYCRNCKYSFECFWGTFGFEIALRSACFLGRWFSAGFTFCLPMCWVYLIHKQCSGRLGWSEHWTYINPCCFPVIFLFLRLDFFLCFWYRYYGNTGTICGGTDGTKFLRYRETLTYSAMFVKNWLPCMESGYLLYLSYYNELCLCPWY